MKPTSGILVPIDFSPTAERAFRFAIRTASLLRAQLHVLHVMYPQMENFEAPQLSSVEATSLKSDRLKKELEIFVAAEKDRWERKGNTCPRIFIQVQVGSAISVIKKQVENHAFDLIIIGTRDKHEAIEKRLGTVASDVVGNAACPVIVVPENSEDTPIEKVAHAIELDGKHPSVVSNIVSRFLPLHRELHLVQYRDETERIPQSSLQPLQAQLQTQFPELKVKMHQLDKKDLIQDLNEFVEKEQIDLLIMYRRANSFWYRLFHRSRTRLMARYTQIPLLVI